MKFNTIEDYPKQASYLGYKCEVVFGYNTEDIFTGTIIRDDGEKPHVTIIALDNGKVVLSIECQFRPIFNV